MSAQLFDFPTRANPPRACLGDGERPQGGGGFPRAQVAAGGSAASFSRRKYNFAEMVRLNGLEEYEPRTQVDLLRDLHSQCGLPLPRNPRRWGGKVQRGAAAIGQRSVWGAPEVDAWLDGQHTPPPAADALPPPASPTVRAECADRARQLASA